MFYLSFESLAQSLPEFLSQTHIYLPQFLESDEDMKDFLGNVINTDSFPSQHTNIPFLVSLKETAFSNYLVLGLLQNY